MSKNLKPDYLRKLKALETRNGYKIDLLNYIYNPSYGNEYPAFCKIIEETENTVTKQCIRYFKFWDGSGAYQVETYKLPKNNDRVNIATDIQTRDIEKSNRFNLNKLIAITETM